MFPDHMLTPFDRPVHVVDRWVPLTLHWRVVGAALRVMRREDRELPHFRAMLASALATDGLLIGA
jgi:hypothetical protein